MNGIRIKLMVAGSVIAVAVTLLAVAGMKEGWVYFLPVDQFVENAEYATQRVRLHGRAGEEGFESSRGLLLAKFDLLGETQKVRIEYNGVIPDMFQAGRDVVVEGCLDESGVFQADTLLTKCASKYDTADGQAPHADPHADSHVGQEAAK